MSEGNPAGLSDFCGVKINVLPDFLLDHTLLQKEFDRRLPEFCARWTQFIHRLWSWKEEAIFCLRFDGRPAEGSVGIYLLARPRDPNMRMQLQRDIEFALAAYGVVRDPEDFGNCLRLLTPEEIRESGQSAGDRAALEAEIAAEFGKALAPDLSRAKFVAVTQEFTPRVWTNQSIIRDITGDSRFKSYKLDPPGAPAMFAWIPLMWDGPCGSFLLPFKALMAAKSPLQLSVYLAPCVVNEHERLWLEKIAALAPHNIDEKKPADPAALTASWIAANAARRLLRQAFLVSVQCMAPDGNEEAALSLANSIQALCLDTETPATGKPDDPLPGACCTVARTPKLQSARESHLRLSFPRWTDSPEIPPFLRRLPYLGDARAAATVFRLPVSVRGGVPGVEVEQPPPDFNPGPRGGHPSSPRLPRPYRIRKPKRKVTIGKFEMAGHAAVDLDDFTKHVLITGFTGSGKTRTVLHLLHQFWADHQIPFLVIESAKSEYRGLIGVPAFKTDPERHSPGGGLRLLIHTLGNETVSPLRLNPFEIIPGVRIESHVNRLQTCFEAALPPFAPLASILEQSLIEVYRDGGWMMTDQGPPREELRKRRFPVMAEFAAKLEKIGHSRGYEGENKATLLAAIRGRILPLTRAMHNSKGRMLDTRETWPQPDHLFSTPAILELNDLSEQDKALVAMFILTLLREFREQQHSAGASAGAGRLRHVTVVEEAHNVLENVKSTGGQEGAGADTKYKAVQAFCGMLAEIRALGEGLVIADQSPEKLAPDAMRNTNIQIAHQLRDARDREAIANAMIMTEEQREYLGKLKPGHAGVFYTGLQKASFVKVPQFDNPEDEGGGRGAGFRAVITDREVADHMEAIAAKVREPDRPFANCRHCGHFLTCDFRWPIHELLPDAQRGEKFRAVFAKSEVPPAVRFERLAPLLAEAAASIGHTGAEDAAWCYLLHMRQRHLAHFETGGPFDRTCRRYFDEIVRPILRAPPPRAPEPNPRTS